ncbi:MAG: adenylate/guanylate cyclase domain-containing protein [Desulfobacterales bacterium]|nr:MAG: adenylate/guanylate cyclase domain-containing protein [Desulfobacterales bacterium]
MSLLTKATIAGLLVGALGVVTSLTPSGAFLEENVGLHFLFNTRGQRQAPAEIVIISMDKASAERLNLPSSPRKWPRSLHARLINTLIAKKPAVIAFDIIFIEDFSPQHDQIFAEAIRAAGNVVLGEWLKVDKVPVLDRSGIQIGNINIEEIVSPISLLANSALATAPFALPKVPIRLNRYWVFKTGAGDTPTLPVVAFQVYALQVYNELIALLKDISPSFAQKLPPNRDALVTNRGVKEVVQMLGDHFEQDPTLAKKILEQLRISKPFSNDAKKHQVLESLISMYHGPKSRYLNFYGPPGTIKTIPYYQIMENLGDPAVYSARLDLNGKAIFVGLSERMRPEQKDGFYTVFSQPNGLDISGVEIVASAFANILENLHVRPLPAGEHLAVVGLWGIMIGILCILSPTLVSASIVVCFSIIYMLVIHYQFKHAAIWFPLVVPLGFQAPAAFFGSIFWKYFRANKERKNIRTAFGYYLPDEIVNQLVKSMSNIKNSGQVVYGTCLVTDIEQYTAISETMNPEDLSDFMNQYFEVIFKPVRQNSGIVSDVKGDSMLAIWATARPDANIRNLACKTALDIIQAVNQFNRSLGTLQLPTRIGMHSGYISLGHIGAIDHYEYRAVGDIVNTASRMEGLNKYLGTQIIASEEVLLQLDGFLIRPLGRFILAGKSKPIEAYELICRIEECTEKQKDACREFNGALEAYQRQCWEEAIDLLSKTLKICGEDGPSRFYLELCGSYRTKPPGTTWNGTVHLDNK